METVTSLVRDIEVSERRTLDEEVWLDANTMIGRGVGAMSHEDMNLPSEASKHREAQSKKENGGGRVVRRCESM